MWWETERVLFGVGCDAQVDNRYRAWLRDVVARTYAERERELRWDADDELSIGYVTYDSCPGVGDDTEHEPIPSYPVPVAIQSKVTLNGTILDGVTDDTLIDFVVVAFNADQVAETLNSIVGEDRFSVRGAYSPVLSNELLGFYAQMAWN